METILVTGGAGFIGSNFIRYIIEKYEDIKVINLDKLTYAGNLDNLKDIENNIRYQFIKGDICDQKIVNPLVKKSDYVINFAAETHVDRSINDPLPFIKTDVYGTGILLNAIKNYNIKRFIQISTDEVYGEALHPEGSKVNDELLPKSPYAASKAGADRLAYAYFKTYDLPITITRCSNNYGPYQYPEKLIPLFITNLLEEKKVPVYGTGKNTRDWVHVLDHAEAIYTIMKRDDVNGEVFNIGGKVEKSVLEIANLLLKILNKTEDCLEFIDDRLGHVKRHAVDIEKTKKIIGWVPKKNFKSEMKNTINWYIDNQLWWKKIKDRGL